MSENHIKVAIIGSGPAGLTAAIYAARANLSPVIFEGMQPGGQLTITTEVENYPGFEDGIQGPELMDVMRKQACKFGAKCEFKEVTEVDFSQKPFVFKSEDKTYTADSIIVSTGASARLLGIETETKFMGYGVSACATCDGFFYKGLKVLVVGGGDTALEEANYLTNFASEVVLIHRREGFRASKIMLDRAKKNPKITFALNRTIKEVVGEEGALGMKKVTGAILENMQDGSTEEIQTDGIFIAIGHKPNTKIFENKLDMDETGYLKVKAGSTYTNIEGVFAAGDVTDKTYRQAVTAAGTGCMAALDAQRWLEEKEIV
ncbi:MAG: thioredoxin-disulfide reductase [Ignavibacteriae bacterium]|nr:thioredoxin-disulfide reductase [Ignavibacteriota bacterium]